MGTHPLTITSVLTPLAVDYPPAIGHYRQTVSNYQPTVDKQRVRKALSMKTTSMTLCVKHEQPVQTKHGRRDVVHIAEQRQIVTKHRGLSRFAPNNAARRVPRFHNTLPGPTVWTHDRLQPVRPHAVVNPIHILDWTMPDDCRLLTYVQISL